MQDSQDDKQNCVGKRSVVINDFCEGLDNGGRGAMWAKLSTRLGKHVILADF